jgi:hypothetical protein
MDPASYAKAGSEHAHQVALFMWASQNREKYPELEWMFAIPNGGLRDKIVAARMKAEGVRAGVSDIFLPAARGRYHGLFIEMKAPGKLSGESDKQKQFGAHVSEQGYYYRCLDNWDDARELICWYLDGTL